MLATIAGAMVFASCSQPADFDPDDGRRDRGGGRGSERAPGEEERGG